MSKPTANETALNFLHDFAYWLREEAEEARDKSDQATKDDPNTAAFDQGRTLAYYEVFSHFVGQLEAFGIPARRLGLEGVDPDRLLLGKGR
jgi:hypothetical protein